MWRLDTLSVFLAVPFHFSLTGKALKRTDQLPVLIGIVQQRRLAMLNRESRIIPTRTLRKPSPVPFHQIGKTTGNPVGRASSNIVGYYLRRPLAT